VGGTGVCVDSFRDFETIYEAFVGNMDLDKIHSAWTINPLANVFVAMYCALADKRGVPRNKLRCTPQNDILKEVVARGTHLFPLKHGMRMTRDTIQFSVTDMPGMNPVSIGDTTIVKPGPIAPSSCLSPRGWDRLPAAGNRCRSQHR